MHVKKSLQVLLLAASISSGCGIPQRYDFAHKLITYAEQRNLLLTHKNDAVKICLENDKEVKKSEQSSYQRIKCSIN